MIDLKKILTTELGKKNGVYSIFNKVTKKYYFGSTAEKRGFRSRWSNHLIQLRNNKHGNKHLQRAFNKYGEDSFEFKIRVICKPHLCLKLEQIYLDVCLKAKEGKRIFKKMGYNINPVAGSSSGYKMSKKRKLKNREQKHRRAIIAINSKLEIIHEAVSIREMARNFGFERSLITKVLYGKMRTHKGLLFCFKEEFLDKINVIKNDSRYFMRNKGLDNNWCKKKVRVFNLKNGEVTDVDSLVNAANFSNMTSTNVWRNLQGQRTSKEYKFEYL